MGFVYVAAASTSHVTRGSNVACSPGVSVRARPPAYRPRGPGPQHTLRLAPRCAAGRQGGDCGPARVTPPTAQGAGSVFSGSCPPGRITQLGENFAGSEQEDREETAGQFSLPPPNNYQPALFSAAPLRGLPWVTHSYAFW